MKSSITKRSTVIAGHRTSVSLEDEFWKGLQEIARQREETLSHLIASIDDSRQNREFGFARGARCGSIARHYRNILVVLARTPYPVETLSNNAPPGD